jgi:hypothetical protein
MQRYLLLARGVGTPQATNSTATTNRARIEQLSRDPTITATYGIMDDGAISLTLLCEMPAGQGATELATMARNYGIANVQIMPLVGPDELRAGLQQAERSSRKSLSYA